MTRQKILNAFLIALFGAAAATAAAQAPTGQNNTPRNAPVGITSAPAVGNSTASPAYGGTTPSSDSTMKAPAGAMDSGVPTDMSGYKAARTACDKQPLNSRDQCRTALNARYSSLAPKCQKLSGSALDDCLKGADAGQ